MLAWLENPDTDQIPNSKATKAISITPSLFTVKLLGAEIAAARYFGIEDFVPTVDTFKNEPDIWLGGLGLEVKQTGHKAGHLIVTDDDRDTDVAVLVVGESPTYYVVGWIPVSVAKKPRYKASDGSYWVSQINLQPIENLKRGQYANSGI